MMRHICLGEGTGHRRLVVDLAEEPGGCCTYGVKKTWVWELLMGWRKSKAPEQLSINEQSNR